MIHLRGLIVRVLLALPVSSSVLFLYLMLQLLKSFVEYFSLLLRVIFTVKMSFFPFRTTPRFPMVDSGRMSFRHL